MKELDWRALILGFLKGIYKKDELMKAAEIVECSNCGSLGLREYIHFYNNNVYCEKCWVKNHE